MLEKIKSIVDSKKIKVIPASLILDLLEIFFQVSLNQ